MQREFFPNSHTGLLFIKLFIHKILLLLYIIYGNRELSMYRRLQRLNKYVNQILSSISINLITLETILSYVLQIPW